jgi:hypothetical protein
LRAVPRDDDANDVTCIVDDEIRQPPELTAVSLQAPLSKAGKGEPVTFVVAKVAAVQEREERFDMDLVSIDVARDPRQEAAHAVPADEIESKDAA